MASRHTGLTPAIANCYAEAAKVCLDRHHTPPKNFSIQKDSLQSVALVSWDSTNNRIRNAWANDDDATRDGAYACALAAVELRCQMVAVRRAETLTGSDYYIGSPDKTYFDLEDCYRLEVSGVDKGNDAEINRRLKQKVLQTAHGKSNLPALACVVGFKIGRIVLQSVGML
jgi:hypothetical protein